MRKQFCDALVQHGANENVLFMTGDLGFMALEPIQSAMGTRFINAGIAEQNMVSIAAAMASEGFETWVYSIAPFCYARPFEQIRNDVCFHNLPVKLVGNGGGYGYGVMGPTHHAIEDYGVILTLPNISAYIPVFDEDLTAVVKSASENKGPVYLRLGRGEQPQEYSVPEYAPWRQLLSGGGAVVVVLGPIAGTFLKECSTLPKTKRPKLWVVSELPISKNDMPIQLIEQISDGPGLCIVEEHVARGGIGSEIALKLFDLQVQPKKFIHLHALSHQFDKYGSQTYLRKKSQLSPKALLTALESI